MMVALRLRLTLVYLAVLIVVIGLLSLGLYLILDLSAQTDVQHTLSPTLTLQPGRVPAVALPLPALLARIGAVDLGVGLLGAVGAYAVAGYALRPSAAALEAQRRFAVAASHELRTPLAVVQGTLDAALLRRRTPEQYEEIVQRATRETEHLGGVLDALLDLAHREQGRDVPPVVVLDLRTVARAAVENMRPAAVGKGHVVLVRLDVPLPIRGDGAALGQAIGNLLDNAVTYMPAGGTIHLSGHRQRGRALLLVGDTGPGIAPEHLPHLCEPLYRVDPARSSTGGHVGLGLTHADAIARAHNGRLSVRSRVGHGSTFTLALPLARSWPVGADRRHPAPRATDGERPPTASPQTGSRTWRTRALPPAQHAPREVLHDQWTTAAGLRLYARVARTVPDPTLPAVILVHGAFISSRYMVPVARRLAPHYNVYAPDLPGYGKSTHPAQVPTVAGFADVLLQWMDAVGITRAAFVGNSFGCQIIAALGARCPERITRAILVGPTVDPGHRTVAQQAGRLLVDGVREPLRYLPLLLGDGLRIGPRTGAQLVRVVLADHIESMLPHLRIPTLVVRGARDPLVPQRWAEEATRLLPMGRLVVIPSVAHVAHFDAPDAFVQLARPFLDA